MSLNYEANNRQQIACSFAGNGTVNNAAPPSVSAANAAASSCVANPSAVFTPSAAATSNAGGAAQSSGTTGSNHNSGSLSLGADPNALLGMTLMAAATIFGGVWTLA